MEINDLMFTGWTLDEPIDPSDVGETIVIRATHTSGNWATLLLSVTGRDEYHDVWDVELETILDGSAGILEAYLNK